MTRRGLSTLALTLATAGIAVATAGAGSDVHLTPIGRLPFPDRGYVIDLPAGAAVGSNAVVVRENGHRVRDLQVTPLQSSGIHFGVMLAIDASASMRGAPLEGAMAAARAFLGHRQEDEEVGILAFNGDVRVLEAPTSDGSRLRRVLSHAPRLGYGTRIYDALDRSLTLLDRAKLSTGSVVLLSDGADLGSRNGVGAVLERARSLHVRVFTVGLRSQAFDAGPLQALAGRTGGSYADARTADHLKSLYTALGRRLSGEYLVRYRSDARPHSRVGVAVEVAGVGTGKERYTAPTPAGLRPFHRSFVSRLLLSQGAVLLLSLLVAALAALALVVFVRPRRSTLADRVAEFAGQMKAAEGAAERRIRKRVPTVRRINRGWFTKLEQDLEIARIDMPVMKVVLLTAAATASAMLILGLLSPVFVVLGLLTPLLSRSLIGRKLRSVRDHFADQLAPNLQVLASALRVGHSFIGALTVVVENAHEPSQTELRRVLTDEQLGVSIEEGIRRVATRMASRDLEQVALLAELQRTAGGNAAEVLDTVVETLRERADLRRLMRTLTAQGRMARWILTCLPIVVGLAMLAIQPDMMRPLFTSGGGQIALVIASVMVTFGSLVIQKIIDIEV